MPEGYRIFVNPARTILVRVWPDGEDQMAVVEIAQRPTASHTWGPPMRLEEER